MSYTFLDYYKNKVTLSFEKEPYSPYPKHVWVICRYNDDWLLTKHRTRGLEFPGGKVEAGETAREAAVREVLEETGGIVQDLAYIGQYYVHGKREHIIKSVYFATIARLEKQPTYFETDGPQLIKAVPNNVKIRPDYSFMMKDDVLPRSLQYIHANIL